MGSRYQNESPGVFEGIGQLGPLGQLYHGYGPRSLFNSETLGGLFVIIEDIDAWLDRMMAMIEKKYSAADELYHRLASAVITMAITLYEKFTKKIID
jgi:hypothetical protein